MEESDPAKKILCTKTGRETQRERKTKGEMVRRERRERDAEIGELLRRQEKSSAFSLKKSSPTQGFSTNRRNYYYCYYYYHHHHHQKHKPFSWSVDWTWRTTKMRLRSPDITSCYFFLWG